MIKRVYLQSSLEEELNHSMAFIDTGYDWLDITITLGIPLIWYLTVFKPWKLSTKNGNTIVDSFKKAGGKRGYVTKKQKEFDFKYMLWGGLTSLTFFAIWLVSESRF